MPCRDNEPAENEPLDSDNPPVHYLNNPGARESGIQAIAFPKDKFTKAKAEGWLKDHAFTPIMFEETPNYWRARIQDPKKFASIWYQEVKGGVKLLLGSTEAREQWMRRTGRTETMYARDNPPRRGWYRRRGEYRENEPESFGNEPEPFDNGPEFDNDPRDNPRGFERWERRPYYARGYEGYPRPGPYREIPRGYRDNDPGYGRRYYGGEEGYDNEPYDNGPYDNPPRGRPYREIPRGGRGRW